MPFLGEAMDFLVPIGRGLYPSLPPPAAVLALMDDVDQGRLALVMWIKEGERTGHVVVVNRTKPGVVWPPEAARLMPADLIVTPEGDLVEPPAATGIRVEVIWGPLEDRDEHGRPGRKL